MFTVFVLIWFKTRQEDRKARGHLTRTEKQQQWIDRELSDVSSVYNKLSLLHHDLIFLRIQYVSLCGVIGKPFSQVAVQGEKLFCFLSKNLIKVRFLKRAYMYVSKTVTIQWDS